MKTKLLSILFASLLYTNGFSQCSESDEYKVLLIGDSWAFFMGVDGTFNTVFEKWGHSNYKYFTNPVVAENGARTTDFLETSKQNEIASLLQSYPSIEVVHLSIGGNDVLGQWDVGFTPAELQDLTDEVYYQVLEIFDFIKAARPGIKIVFSGYCYPNFEEVIESVDPLQNIHPFYGTWSGMGFPNFLQINTILNDFSQEMEDYAATDPQVEFIKATGLMQYTFGQNDPLGVAPGGTYPPFSLSLPYGDPNYPSPKNSMRDYAVTKDCFHLSPKGYRDLISYQTQKFYHKFLMKDQYLLSTEKEGGISNSNSTSNQLLVGSNANEEFAAILDFNTENMYYEGLEKAEIFLQIQEISGVNPLNSALELSIKSGNIGSSAYPENSDWTASVDLSETTCLFGNKNDVGNWIRIELPTSFFSHISSSTNTQILIKSTNSAEGLVRFSASSDPEFAPVLNLKYDDGYVGIRSIEEISLVQIYPNPAKNTLNIFSPEASIQALEIYNALGALCLKSTLLEQNRIDIANLANGFYQIVVQTDKGRVSKSFVKD
ncbi:MAG: T9SS type A sorting domain-containing protein [Chitinophagales bacterium]|nr:SGNH/GDSL hydrolase family protein [Bacteroidota bacterium]MCB9256362.1 T9SS type A sorting domain-containing protein [Chitinophagales bacterium]